jgi:hypothetical protein
MSHEFKNDLDNIIFARLIEAVQMQKTKTISLDLEDLLENGYSVEEIQESMDRISKIDARKVFEETKDIPEMTMQ